MFCPSSAVLGIEKKCKIGCKRWVCRKLYERKLISTIMTKLISSYLYHNKHSSIFTVKLAYRIAGPGSHLHNQYKVHDPDMILICKAFVGCDDLIGDFIGLLEKYKALNTNPSDPLKNLVCKWHYHRNMENQGDCPFKAKDL